ncbi:hypothetical protein GCM10027444_12590 [Actinopolyspora lacussalsi]
MSEKFRVELLSLTGYAGSAGKERGPLGIHSWLHGGSSFRHSGITGSYSGCRRGLPATGRAAIGVSGKMAGGLKGTSGALMDSEHVYRSHDDAASSSGGEAEVRILVVCE